jgi:hypothetical protein
MRGDALRSPVVSKIREEIPEFEDSFQTALVDEDGEMGSFQAMSTFGAWLTRCLQVDPGAPEVQRSFSVVEQIASSAEYPMGRALVTEFVEAIGDSSEAIGRLGPASRAFLGPT